MYQNYFNIYKFRHDFITYFLLRKIIKIKYLKIIKIKTFFN